MRSNRRAPTGPNSIVQAGKSGGTYSGTCCWGAGSYGPLGLEYTSFGPVPGAAVLDFRVLPRWGKLQSDALW